MSHKLEKEEAASDTNANVTMDTKVMVDDVMMSTNVSLECIHVTLTVVAPTQSVPTHANVTTIILETDSTVSGTTHVTVMTIAMTTPAVLW